MRPDPSAALLAAACLLVGACGGAGAGTGPCAKVDCSGHGQCAVIGGTEAACVCDSGYQASGLACVVAGSAQPVPAGASSLGLTVPSATVEAISPDGRYLLYASMAATSDPAKFTLGHEKIRNLSTGHEVDLGKAALHCGNGGCAVYATWVTFAAAGGDVAYTGLAGAPATLDLKSGQTTPVPAPKGQFAIGRMPDLSGFVTMKQTYAGNPGSVSYVDDATSKVTRLAITGNDPSPLGDVALEGTASKGEIALHLDERNVGETLDLWTVPGLSKTVVGALNATHVGFAGKRLLYVLCSSPTLRCNRGEVVSVPLSGSPKADLGTNGDWLDPSPAGTFVLLVTGQGDEVVRVDGTGTPMALSDAPTTVAWRDDSSFYFLDDRGDLKRFDTASKKTTGIATGVARFGLLDSGIVVVDAPGTTTTAQITVTDGTTSGPLFLTPLAPARLIRNGKTTPLGKANLADWRFGGKSVFRSYLYFDVLNGFAPGKGNGSVVFAP